MAWQKNLRNIFCISQFLMRAFCRTMLLCIVALWRGEGGRGFGSENIELHSCLQETVRLTQGFDLEIIENNNGNSFFLVLYCTVFAPGGLKLEVDWAGKRIAILPKEKQVLRAGYTSVAFYLFKGRGRASLSALIVRTTLPVLATVQRELALNAAEADAMVLYTKKLIRIPLRGSYLSCLFQRRTIVILHDPYTLWDRLR